MRIRIHITGCTHSIQLGQLLSPLKYKKSIKGKIILVTSKKTIFKVEVGAGA